MDIPWCSLATYAVQPRKHSMQTPILLPWKNNNSATCLLFKVLVSQAFVADHLLLSSMTKPGRNYNVVRLSAGRKCDVTYSLWLELCKWAFKLPVIAYHLAQIPSESQKLFRRGQRCTMWNSLLSSRYQKSCAAKLKDNYWTRKLQGQDRSSWDRTRHRKEGLHGPLETSQTAFFTTPSSASARFTWLILSFSLATSSSDDCPLA